MTNDSMTRVIDGKQIAAGIITELKRLSKPDKTLAAVFVGESEASESFLRQKSKLAAELGIDFRIYRFSEDISEDELKNEIQKIGDDAKVGGMIIQLPLPPKFNRDNVLSVLNPEKDIDGLLGKIKPLAVRTVETILGKTGFDIRDRVVAVVGKGLLVGKPIAQWLEGKCRELIVIDSKGDITQLEKADLVITGVGKAGLIKPEMLKNGAGVIDFGYSAPQARSRTDADYTQTHAETMKRKWYGDFDSERLVSLREISRRETIRDKRLAFYTPTPGGTGPILVAELLRAFYELCA